MSGDSYTPNHIDSSTRIGNLFLSACLLGYGIYGVYVDDIYIPGKRSPGTHFHGEPAWFLCAAMVCSALNMLSVVVDHYDIRNNEINYKRFATVTQVLSWTFFLLGLLLDVFVWHKGTH